MSHSARGAWIETINRAQSIHGRQKSHSARGAWIETTVLWLGVWRLIVALREGCVDRNLQGPQVAESCVKSHSARGAWIETQVACPLLCA